MLSLMNLNVSAYSYLLPIEGDLISDKQLEKYARAYTKYDKVIFTLLDSFLDDPDSPLLKPDYVIGIIYAGSFSAMPEKESIKGYLTSIPNINAFNTFCKLNSLDYHAQIGGIYTTYGSCSSSMQALELADNLLKSQSYDAVLIITLDILGEHHYKLFEKMKLLTKDECRPFFKKDTGFNLSECGVAMLVTHDHYMNDKMTLEDGLFRITHIAHKPSMGIVMPTADDIHEISKELVEIVPTNRLIGIISHGTSSKECNTQEYQGLMETLNGYYGTSFQPDARIYALKRYLGHTLSSSGTMEAIDFYETWLEDLPDEVAVYTEEEKDLVMEPVGDLSRLAYSQDTFLPDADHIVKLAYGMGGMVYGMVIQFPKF